MRKQKNEKVKDCPECKGSGIQPGSIDAVDDGNDCPTCGGNNIEDCCESCEVPWHDHLGISGTCAKLEKARKTLEAIAECANNLTPESRFYHMAKDTLDAIK